MKKGIHPQTHKDCVVTCACGNTFTTMSTQEAIRVEICSMCHPFYTGQQKFVDTEGRIEKFNKKLEISKERKVKSSKKPRGKQEKTQKAPATLKELLEQAKNTDN